MKKAPGGGPGAKVWNEGQWIGSHVFRMRPWLRYGEAGPADEGVVRKL
jgi:hypothetical protein